MIVRKRKACLVARKRKAAARWIRHLHGASRWWRVALIVLLAGVVGSPASGDPSGVRLTFKVRFRAIPVGNSTYTWVPRGDSVVVAKELIPSGPLAKLYRIDDRFVARIGSDGRPTLLYERIDEPNERRQDRWTTLDWQRGLATLLRHDFRTGEWDRRVIPAKAGLQWPLTLPYWILQRPLAELDGARLPLLDGDKVKEVRLKLEGQERLRTGLGRVDTDQVEGAVWYRSERQRYGGFTAWIRREAPRIPVRITTRLRFGPLSEVAEMEESVTIPPELPVVPIDTGVDEN